MTFHEGGNHGNYWELCCFLMFLESLGEFGNQKNMEGAGVSMFLDLPAKCWAQVNLEGVAHDLGVGSSPGDSLRH